MRRMVMLVGVLSAALAASARAETVVTISKSQQRLAVTVDGVELHRWPVSTGRRGLDTPSGSFRPIRFERQWYSRKYDWSPMPYSVFFHGGYAVHGTFEKRRLGQAASHGCVRLLPENAATLFSLLRREGKSEARIVVTDAPLPALRGAAEAGIKVPLPAPHKPEFAAPPAQVKRVAVLPEPKPEPKPAPKAAPQPRATPQTVHRVIATHSAAKRVEARYISAGDEAAVLRGREAWLRSLDRKYGRVR